MSKKIEKDATRRIKPALGRAAPSKTYMYRARNGLYYAKYLSSPDAREDYFAGNFKPLIKYPKTWKLETLPGGE